MNNPYTPQRIFGRNATQCGTAGHSDIAAVSIDGSTNIKVLKWALSDFEVEGSPAGDGWFVTYQLIIGAEEFNLQQQRSVFFMSDDQIPIQMKSVPKKSPKKYAGNWPTWHKADRFWPVLDGSQFDFEFQFYYDDKVSYLYSHDSSDGMIYAIFHDEINRQDAEDHYKLENDIYYGRVKT